MEDPAVRVRRFHNAMARTKARERFVSFVLVLPPEVRTIARVQGDLKRLNIVEDPQGAAERLIERVLGAGVKEGEIRPWLVVDESGAAEWEEAGK